MSFLKTENLQCKFGLFLLKNINMSIDKSGFLSIIGKSGSGKTVLLESIAGLHKVSGHVYLDGQEITHKQPQNRQIGIVYQDYMLFPNMNVQKNIMYASLFKKNSSTQALFNEIVDFFNIRDILKRDVKNLSGGEKQKVAIARTLLSFPKLLLLDEPLNAVDFTFRISLMEFLKNLYKKYELTIIYVTHNFKEAMFFQGKTAVMLDGEIKQTGWVNDVFANPKSRDVAEFLGFKNILNAEIINRKDFKFFSVAPDKISITKDKKSADFCMQAAVTDINNMHEFNILDVRVKKETIKIKTTEQIEKNSQYYICFNKNDISLFN